MENFKFEKREKPEFLYHGSNTLGIEEFEPRKRFTPNGEDREKAVYASDIPAFAAAHSFPWGSDEGFELSVKEGKVIFEVPMEFKDRLNVKICVYKVASEKFNLTEEEKTGHTYDASEKIKPIESNDFSSVKEAIEHYGGRLFFI
jgi:hypothetical protein